MAECDRCLAPVTLPMNFDERLLVKLVSENYRSEEEQEDEIWMMDENTYEIDLFPFWLDRALCEIQVSDEAVPVTLPPELTVIREVTDDAAYSNAALAGAVPGE